LKASVGNTLRGVPESREDNVVRYARNGTEAVPYGPASGPQKIASTA